MKMHIVNKLQELKQAGASWQREAKGDEIMQEIRDLIPEGEFSQLSIARSHYMTGEGRVELDRVCNELIAKYRADVQPRTFKKTLL
jgi:hypothetical protein